MWLQDFILIGSEYLWNIYAHRAAGHLLLEPIAVADLLTLKGQFPVLHISPNTSVSSGEVTKKWHRKTWHSPQTLTFIKTLLTRNRKAEEETHADRASAVYQPLTQCFDLIFRTRPWSRQYQSSSFKRKETEIQQDLSFGDHTVKEELAQKFQLWFPGPFLWLSSEVAAWGSEPGSLALKTAH